MANRFAIANGNFNATSTWSDTAAGAGGFSVPVLGDNAYSNNKTVTITADATCDKVSSEAENGATTGGTFILNAGVTLTANVYGGSPGGANGQTVTFQSSTPSVSYIVGNVYGGTVNQSNRGVLHNGSGTLAITGNITAGTFNACNGVLMNAGNGTLNVTGTVNGMPSGSGHAYGISAGAAGCTVNITGNIVSGSHSGSNAGYGLATGSTATVNITGNISGGSGNTDMGLAHAGIGIVTIVGNVTGGSSNGSHGVSNESSGTIYITGTVTGGSAVTAYGVRNTSTGAVYITGTTIGGTVMDGTNNSSTGTVKVTRAKGNGYGIGSVGLSATFGFSSTTQGSLNYVEEIEYGALGQSPVAGAIILTDKTSNVALFYRPSLSKKTLIDAASIAGAMPAASDVRYGTTFNQGNSTGTCYVPSASNVMINVNVDNTVGTLMLTAANIWNTQTSTLTTVGSIGERLANVSTVSTMGAQLSAALTS